MDAQKTERKLVSRNGAVITALGIAVIILLASLLVVENNYNSMLNTKEETISSLNNTINQYWNIMTLHNTTVWVDDQTVSQPANSYSVWTFSTDYAGVVDISILSSTANTMWSTNTTIQVIWTSDVGYFPCNYDSQKVIAHTVSGYAFPILPPQKYPSRTYVEIRVGNVNPTNSATEKVRIVFVF